MIIYNGFKPGEERSKRLRPRKADGGHSAVEIKVKRDGDRFRFTYTVVCECGNRYSSKQVMERASRSHDDHVKKELGL